MELHVTRDKSSELKDAKILNLSSEDWVVIERSLKTSLISEQESLEYFQNNLEHKIECQYNLKSIKDTKIVLEIIENAIDMLEKVIKAFDEPITTREL